MSSPIFPNGNIPKSNLVYNLTYILNGIGVPLVENRENITPEKKALVSEIKSAIQDVAYHKEAQQIKSLSRYDPEKVANILYLYGTGVSQTAMVKKHGFDRETVINTLVDYADHKGKFRELGGKLSGRNYVNLSSLTEDLVGKLRKRLEEGDIEASFKDLKDLSIALTNAHREASTSRGDATVITEERKVATIEDAQKLREQVLSRIKKADIIDEQDGE
mgnify:FL=1